jgi:peptidoglycan/xylan/chitin deacetylase (PgdA/CDA1 family)
MTTAAASDSLPVVSAPDLAIGGNVATACAPVFLYHSVAWDPDPRIADFSLAPDEFDKQLDLIAGSGRTSCTFSEFASRLSAGLAVSDLVCITFDDGWRDNLAAAKLIAERGLKCTVFVTSSYIGRRGMLTASELKELAELPGVEIGAHGKTHVRFDEISQSRSEAELHLGKGALELMISQPISTVAYPHGAYSARVRVLAEKAGFTSAAAVKNALSHAGDDPMAVARFTIKRTHDERVVAKLLDGRGAPRAWKRERVRTRASRVVRTLRRRLGGDSG